MGIRYDDAVTTGGSIPGTMQFVGFGGVYHRERGHNRVDKTHAIAGGSDNGRSVMFTITIDPVGGRFKLGEAEFTQSAVAWGIHMGIFIEGTEWMTPTGRVRIMRGKLRYTRNKKIYELPEIREARNE